MFPFLHRARTYAVARLRMRALALRNRLSVRRVVAPGGPVVSVTSFGTRVDTVHLAVESIARGTLRPSRLQLWLDDPWRVEHPTPGLRRLVERGVEVRLCPDLGPHKKYYPSVSRTATHTVPLVTADDDALYHRRWLATLAAAHRRDPEAIHAHRVDRLTVIDGELQPYTVRSRALDLDPTPRNVAIGIKGILYPPAFLTLLHRIGPAFQEVAPRSTDVWLHHVALLDRRPVLPVLDLRHRTITNMRGLPSTPALTTENVTGGRNDRLIATVLTEAERTAIREDSYAPLGTGLVHELVS